MKKFASLLLSSALTVGLLAGCAGGTSATPAPPFHRKRGLDRPRRYHRPHRERHRRPHRHHPEGGRLPRPPR